MSKRMNVVLIVLDACRREILKPYASISRDSLAIGPAHTPQLDKFCRDGVVIRDCQSCSSSTAISVASILTGVGPHRHGVTTLIGASIFDSVPTFGSLFQQKGYTTAFFPSSAVLNRTTGLGTGFSHFDDEFLQPLYDDLQEQSKVDLKTFRRHFYKPPSRRLIPGALRFCEITVEAVKTWLSRTADPFALVVHLIEPHYPYWPPKGWRVSDDPLDAGNYVSAINYVDQAFIGPLLDLLHARGSDVITVVTTDHGEYLGEHGFRDTGDHGDLYQTVLAVPLMIGCSEPRINRSTSEAAWSHLDLLPTIYSLATGDRAENVEGKNRTLDIEEQPRPSWEDAAYNDPSYVRDTGGLRRGGVAIRLGKHKLIRRAPGLGEDELYDLENDPGEHQNLVDLKPDVLRALEQHLPPLCSMPINGRSELPERLAALG